MVALFCQEEEDWRRRRVKEVSRVVMVMVMLRLDSAKSPTSPYSRRTASKGDGVLICRVSQLRMAMLCPESRSDHPPRKQRDSSSHSPFSAWILRARAAFFSHASERAKAVVEEVERVESRPIRFR